MKIDCYIVILSGQGDTEVKLVNKETWDWINNKDICPPELQVSKYIDISKEYQYCEQTTEDIIKQMNGGKNGNKS